MDFKETFPKSGHVHEVCKEWLVREDGALAYRLQSQEINEFYQGNKFRNAVVRQDFPTALLEQIKEKETAEQEAAKYHQHLREQEEKDKYLAEKLANKLEKDEKQLDLKQLEESEVIARQLQDTYVNVRAKVHPSESVNSPNMLYLSPKNVSSPSSNQKERLDPSELSDNLICDRFEKLHCRPKEEIIEQKQQHDYEQYLNDITHNIRNADIVQTPSQQQHQQINCYHQRHPYQRKDFELFEDPLQLSSSIQANDIIIDDGSDMIENRNSWTMSSPQIPIPLRKHIKSSAVDKISRSAYNVEKNMQLNIPTAEYENLNDLGLSCGDVNELKKKIQQEKRDEELARHLQKEEQRRNLTQEEKDRLLAIEAQDKELAIMLQEREKSKAKRAREKARLKKLQAKEALTENSKLPIVNEPYSNPRDFITESQQFKYNSKKVNNIPSSPITGNIDMMDRTHYNSNNGDDIYALPIDNTSTEIDDTKSSEEMSASINSSKSVLSSPSSLTPNYHQSESFPKPPYMPIHDIGNNLPSEGRKKKSKDKCTHQ